MKVTLLGPEFIGDPEVTCMLQAFASRSKMPIEERLASLGTDFSAIKTKLRQYYVGYGHDSVGQCANVTFFLEDVSILAAKAIQHNQLYNGIESSTRYIDFMNEPLVGTGVLPDQIQRAWIDLYADVARAVEVVLCARYANTDGSSPLMAKACKLKAFDIARAFLPAGVTTNLSWTTSISTLNRELVRLSRHVLKEVRDIAVVINEMVYQHLPNVWVALPPAVDDYSVYADQNYDPDPHEFQSVRAVKLYNLDLSDRVKPEKYERLPHDVHSSYFVSVISSIDYGSFRDIQRHRTLNPSSPLLQLGSASSATFHGTYGYNFHRWYLDALKELGILHLFEARLHHLLMGIAIESAREYRGKLYPFDLQYYLPLGLEVPVTLQGYLGDWLYVLQLRSTPSVHPTVRLFCESVWSQLQANLNQSLFDYLTVNMGTIPQEDPLMLRPHLQRANQDVLKKS